MTQEVFARYAKATVEGYANENIAAGRWSPHDALERASKELNALLPQGLGTPDNYLYEIQSAKGGATVGYLWWAVEERRGVRGAYIYDVAIHEAFRRQGHARRTFEHLESLVASLGISSLALHVFAHNSGAQALYEQLGFKVTGINMLKHLSLPNA
jgi:ribosomal protein S18 acetylase RimI-like enzyme